MAQTSPATDVALTALLEGCPSDLFRNPKIKILHNGGYEHFELVEQSEFTLGSPTTFRWVMRTTIAE
jgi:Family of unknown function (DUF5988)